MYERGGWWQIMADFRACFERQYTNEWRDCDGGAEDPQEHGDEAGSRAQTREGEKWLSCPNALLERELVRVG